jgi:hypothetical protein
MRKRSVIGALSAVLAVSAVAITPAANAYPPPGNVSSVALATVVNTGGGVYWRFAPQESAYQAIPGYGEYDGYTVALDCWRFGGPSGPYANTLWYFAEQYSPLPAQGDGQGWINDHYLNTPGTAANPQPIGPQCPS